MKEKLLSRKFLFTSFVMVALLVAAIMKGIPWEVALKYLLVAAGLYNVSQGYVDSKGAGNG